MHKNIKAFTLIEVLLAVVMLSIGLVGIMRAYAVSLNAYEAACFNVKACEVFKEQIAGFEIEAIEKIDLNPGVTSGLSGDGIRPLAWECDIQSLALPEGKPKDCLNKVVFSVFEEKKLSGRRVTVGTYLENYEAYYK